MKQILIPKYGDTDVLKIQESKDPKPFAGEVLIEVKAVGVTLPIFSQERDFILMLQNLLVSWGMKYQAL